MLRDYQMECLESVFNEFSSGTSRQLISLPTGSGKTVIMGAIAKKLNKRTLLLAHREELIMQAHDKFKLIWPEVDIGFVWEILLRSILRLLLEAFNHAAEQRGWSVSRSRASR